MADINEKTEQGSEQSSVRAENKMGYMPCNQLLISMSVPMMISMLVQALYNVVDSIFVSRLNEAAFTAVSLAFPVQSLMIAISVGTAVGVNALLSRQLGEKKFEAVNRTAGNGILLALLSSAVFIIFGLFGSRLFFSALTEDAQIAEYGVQYTQVVTIFCIGLFLQIIFERTLQATGRTIFNMIGQTVGAVTNIIMDPILIFGLFGFPRMEVTGAAVATVMGQIFGAALGLFFNLKFNKDIDLSFRYLKPDAMTIKRIYAVGFPSILMQSIGSVMNFGMNKILIVFSSTAAAVFGAYFKLQSFIFMPVFGLNNGMVPIIAYNLGAGRPDRIKQTVKLAAMYATIIMLLGLCAFQLLPEVLLGFFDASDNMLSMGVVALRVISLSFIMAGMNIVFSSVFQAMGHGMLSLEASAVRQLIFLLPAAFILARTVGLDGVWWSFPIVEIASTAMSLIFMRKIYKEQLSAPAKTEEEPAQTP